MKIDRIHSLDVQIDRARELQLELAERLVLEGGPKIERLRIVAGCDVAFDSAGKRAFGALVLLSFPELELLELVRGEAPLRFPYIPGYLSFREMEVLLGLFEGLKTVPDAVFADGQGIAHPRGLGLASHLGLFLGLPTIGCAKSRLVGTYREPGQNRGDSSPLFYRERPVGTVLRTRANTKPIFVSPGHLISVENAAALALAVGGRFRVPEPTRSADRLVSEFKRETIQRGLV